MMTMNHNTDDVSSMFRIEGVETLNLSKSHLPIDTGIGFFNHMLDQLNSHAQIGIAVTVSSAAEEPKTKNDVINRYRTANQSLLLYAVGQAIGTSLRTTILSQIKWNPVDEEEEEEEETTTTRTSRFCCPLDEALAECILTWEHRHHPSSSSSSLGSLKQYALAPFGTFGGGGDGSSSSSSTTTTTGRTYVGSLQTRAIEYFMKGLAETSGLTISLVKIRGENGHHVVESSFKALSRALRNFIDGTDTTTTTTTTTKPSSDNFFFEALWGHPNSESYRQSVALQRSGTVQRSTKETKIHVHLQLHADNNNNNNDSSISTGIALLDQIIMEMVQASNNVMTLQVECIGDLHIDDHHTTEDVGIALGQVIRQALGTKAGLNRMWTSASPCCTTTTTNNNNDDGTSSSVGVSVVEVTMDLSNRPCLTSNLALHSQEYVTTADDLLTTEMTHHFFESLVMNAGLTVHIRETMSSSSSSDSVVVMMTMLERILATARAFGQAFAMCASVDPRRAGTTASSKGTLSV